MSSGKEWVAGKLERFEYSMKSMRAGFEKDFSGMWPIGTISVASGIAMATAGAMQALASGAIGVELAVAVAVASVSTGFAGIAAGAVAGIVVVSAAVAATDAGLSVVGKGIHGLREKLLSKREGAAAEPSAKLSI